MLKGNTIVCLSTQDWNGLWTRKQRFMQMFAQNENQVLYIETPVHMLGLDVLPHDPTRFFRFLKGPRQVERNLWVATLPILLPFFQMSHLINTANHMLVRTMLRKWMRTLGFGCPILWVYTPFSESVIDGVDNCGVVYECVDEFRAAKGFIRASVVGEMEDSLLKKVDLCIVTQESLLPRRARLCPQTFCVPNGADTELFRSVAESAEAPSAALATIPHPRLAFVGHIQYWVDLKLIRYIADRRPDWHLILIGPIHPLADGKELRGSNNIHTLGRQPQSEIPRLLKGVDVCLNAYKRDEVATHASPLKLYEYLAAGKPVVSTDMPEAHKFADDVRIATSNEDFLRACDDAIRTLPESQDVISRRIAAASTHSWRNRFSTVNEILQKALEGRLLYGTDK
jgi:glycosyltransferase involved in cell wall biosynthesis